MIWNIKYDPTEGLFRTFVKKVIRNSWVWQVSWIIENHIALFKSHHVPFPASNAARMPTSLPAPRSSCSVARFSWNGRVDRLRIDGSQSGARLFVSRFRTKIYWFGLRNYEYLYVYVGKVNCSTFFVHRHTYIMSYWTCCGSRDPIILLKLNSKSILISSRVSPLVFFE